MRASMAGAISAPSTVMASKGKGGGAALPDAAIRQTARRREGIKADYVRRQNRLDTHASAARCGCAHARVISAKASARSRAYAAICPCSIDEACSIAFAIIADARPAEGRGAA